MYNLALTRLTASEGIASSQDQAKMKKTETLSFKVTPELKTKLEALAKKENRSLSNFVQMILTTTAEKRK
jgi:uncharacterized protein (DUF1778 family)